MKNRIRPKIKSRYLALMIIFLLFVNISLGYLLMRQSKDSIITLMQTRMLDISNTAAAMIDGDDLRSVTPADKGTEKYEKIMRSLTYFQDNIELKYIYCIRDMGDGTFTFGLDPTVEDPGEFGSPIVHTKALDKASKGTAAADDEYYEDAWGKFYSAYSPVFDSQGNVAGIIAVDFSAEWYDQQLAHLTWTTIIVALLSLLVGGCIVITIVTRNERRIGSIRGQLTEMESTLLQEMGNVPETEDLEEEIRTQEEEGVSIDILERQIQTMQKELKTQIAHVHGRAYVDGLTGVKSKQAYLDTERSLDEKLGEEELPGFAIVVCDVNGLKKINDTLGHKAGDAYLCEACEMICDVFSHSPVYRVGGDEFVVLLTGRDYENRRGLMHELHKRSILHISTNEAIVSGGLAEYMPGQDHSIHEIFQRADTTMYEEKMLLKSLGAATREESEEQAEPEIELEDIAALNVRKHLLIVDDVASNREILEDLLQEDYDIYSAADGIEAMEVLREHREEISLLILDLYMPNMTGREVMAEMQADEDLMSIPVIVLTVDQEAELECLRIGASDFIPKPYPDIEIVKARISNCIELSENRKLIRYTQRDKLTGLFNIDYFVRYVGRFDLQYKEAAFDVLACSVRHSYAGSEQYGRHYGDLVIRRIGTGFRKLARQVGGIGCRDGADTFLLYCPHRDDYDELVRKFTGDLFLDKDIAEKVDLHFGVYANAQLEPDIEERFNLARIAADDVAEDTERNVKCI